jgi:hypothetical protein
MSDEPMTSEAFWSEIHSRPTIIGPRTSASTEPPAPAEPPVEPEGLSAEDVPLSEWSDNRAALGIRHQDSDFIGLSSDDDDGSGFPSWRTPVVEQVEFTEMDEYAEPRQASGVLDASDFFGVPQREPRSNASPWSVV